MYRIIISLLFLVFTISFSSCEKDDICAEGTITTPRLVVEFYDATDTSTLKNVTNLGLIAPGLTNGYAFNGVSQITVPLRTTDNTTTLQFIENGSDDDTANDNIDEITFNYTRQDIYVSRACGYKTNFNLDDTNGVVVTSDADNWISTTISPTIEQSAITNEDEIHVKIYF